MYYIFNRRPHIEFVFLTLTLILFSKDAKLGKKCTLLDLSRRPSIAAPEAQGAAALSSEAKDEGLSSLSKPATDHLLSVENFEINERMEEEKKERVEEKEEAEELSLDESPAKMVDPTESQSDEEQSMTECDLVSNSIVFNCMCSMSSVPCQICQFIYQVLPI